MIKTYIKNILLAVSLFSSVTSAHIVNSAEISENAESSKTVNITSRVKQVELANWEDRGAFWLENGAGECSNSNDPITIYRNIHNTRPEYAEKFNYPFMLQMILTAYLTKQEIYVTLAKETNRDTCYLVRAILE